MFLSGKFTNYAKVGWWSDEWRCQSLLLGNDTKTKQMTLRSSALHCLNMSGYQDSNLGPPAPKAGALTGLRYIP